MNLCMRFALLVFFLSSVLGCAETASSAPVARAMQRPTGAGITSDRGLSNCTQGCPTAHVCDETAGTCIRNPCGTQCTSYQNCVRRANDNFGMSEWICLDRRGAEGDG